MLSAFLATGHLSNFLSPTSTPLKYFLETGNLAPFLSSIPPVVQDELFSFDNDDSGDPPPVAPKAKGRPIFTILPTEPNETYTIHDNSNQPATEDRLDEIIQDLKTMLGEYKEDMYAFSEMWYSRVGQNESGGPPETGDLLTAEEKTAILEGDPTKFKGAFLSLFLLRKVEKVKPFQYTLKLGDLSRTVPLSCIYVAKMDNLVETIDTDMVPFGPNTIGIDIGRPFAFPAILKNMPMYTMQRDVFIGGYNLVVLNRIGVLSGSNVSSNDSQTMKKSIITLWNDFVKKVIGNQPKIKLEAWTTPMPNFDINTFSKGTAEMCSAFTWWPNRDVDFSPMALETGEDVERPVSADGENSDYALYRDQKILVPRSSVTSFKAYKKAFTMTGKYKLNGTYNKKVENVEVLNPYKLLAVAGSQSIELSQLASILGSGCHNSAALEAIQRNDRIATSIGNVEYLQTYLNSMPAITHTVGKLIAEINMDNVVAVEFPTYHFDSEIVGGICYSRIDAITKDYTLPDTSKDTGYAIWEYKTRWGTGSAQWKDKAEEADILQAMYYLTQFNEMTGSKATLFYIVYAGISASSAQNVGEVVDVELRVYRFEINGPLTMTRKTE